jgi:hypothetical protein
MTIGGNVTISGSVLFGYQTLAYTSGTVTVSASTLQFDNSPTFDLSGMSLQKVSAVGTGTMFLTSDLNLNTDFAIGSGVTLTVSGAHNIKLKGDWLNSGTYTHGTETVVFKNVGAQTISGNTTFYNLTINDGCGLSLTSTQTFNVANTFTAAGTAGREAVR